MQRDVVCILGKTGSGKTTWARGFVKTLSRALVLDAGFAEYGIDVAPTFDALVAAAQKPFFRVGYTPLQYEVPAMLDLARVAGASGGPLNLILEEADRLDDPRFFPEYDELISRGRHWGISLTAISLYPAKLPAMLRRQSTRMICFRQHEPRDLDYIAEIVGEDAYKLLELENFAFMDWTPLDGVRWGKLGA